MSHQDQIAKQAQGSNAEDLKAALDWTLEDGELETVKLHANCTWTLQQFLLVAFLWSLGESASLVERFTDAHKVIKWLYKCKSAPAKSYQAFIKLLRRKTPQLRERLLSVFRRRIQHRLASCWIVCGWVIFACDGSRIGVPRTRKNEACYSPKSKLSREGQKKRRARKRRTAEQRRREKQQSKANVPQIWLTTIWHLGAGLAWNWMIGPSDSSERDHLAQMLNTLPGGSLLVADAGFVGYDLWRMITFAKLELLIRVGGNVRLLKKLGHVREREGLVYLWPDAAARKRCAPLVLRLIVVEGGSHPVYLVTSVLDPARLSDRDAAKIYARRWGIELFYRNYKQTFKHSKLCSHNPENAAVELEWSLLGMCVLGLHSHYRLISQGVPPEKISFAGVLRAYRRPLREYRCRPEPGQSLLELIDVAIIDSYERKNKASRNYPRRKPDRTPPGPPKIINATPAQIERAQRLRQNASKKRLTA